MVKQVPRGVGVAAAAPAQPQTGFGGSSVPGFVGWGGGCRWRGVGESRAIVLSGFPGVEVGWEGVPVSESIVASVLHRTYDVRTHASMVHFDASRQRCWVRLSSHADAVSVLEQTIQVVPSLHHRDEKCPTGACKSLLDP